MSLVIDASVFVAGCLESEPHYATSLEFLKDIRGARESVYAPALLLPEFAAAIARGTDDEDTPRRLLQMITRIFNLELIPLTRPLAALAAEVAMSSRLRGADACYSAVARDLDATLITWDKEMLRRCPPGVTCMTPDQWRAQHPRPMEPDDAHG